MLSRLYFVWVPKEALFFFGFPFFEDLAQLLLSGCALAFLRSASHVPLSQPSQALDLGCERQRVKGALAQRLLHRFLANVGFHCLDLLEFLLECSSLVSPLLICCRLVLRLVDHCV